VPAASEEDDLGTYKKTVTPLYSAMARLFIMRYSHQPFFIKICLEAN